MYLDASPMFYLTKAEAYVMTIAIDSFAVSGRNSLSSQ
jgi:hypothetical protein